MVKTKVKIIGAGLAGAEASFQLLKRGFSVELTEMRPVKNTPAHKTADIAELVCSNSLKSVELSTASGMLKEEMKRFSSVVLYAAQKAAVPAGSALTVNRQIFSEEIKKVLFSFEGFTYKIDEYRQIDPSVPTIIATGPLTSDALSEQIQKLVGNELHFFDAVAPIVSGDSIDMDIAFFAARYGKGDPDYLNCPFTKEQYDIFYNELINARSVILKDFEENVFEGCMPIEVMAKRGYDAMRFGPLRPVGIYDKNGKRPYAVVQLRKENVQGTTYNLVGFQTNLTFPEQKRVFSLIPSLQNAEFLRYGVMHRNTYLPSPGFLNADFSVIKMPDVFFAGQITGVEGYMESSASGMLAGINMARYLSGKQTVILPRTTICGALQRYISSFAGADFEPMNANFGILPEPDVKIKDKHERKLYYTSRGLGDLDAYLAQIDTI